MTMSPGERKFSNINFSMAEAEDFDGAAKLRSGDLVEARDGKMRTERRGFGLEPGQFRASENDVVVAHAFHDRLAEESDWRIAVLDRFERRSGGGDFLEQSLDAVLRSAGFAELLELRVEHVQAVESGQEFETAALVQANRVGRRRGLAVALWPARRLETGLQARILEVRGWFEDLGRLHFQDRRMAETPSPGARVRAARAPERDGFCWPHSEICPHSVFT